MSQIVKCVTVYREQYYNNNQYYFYCYTVHVVELLNYYTNHCTYI